MEVFTLGFVVIMCLFVIGVTIWDRHRVALFREAYAVRNAGLTLCLLIHPSVNFFTYMLITFMWTIYFGAVFNAGMKNGGFTTE